MEQRSRRRSSDFSWIGSDTSKRNDWAVKHSFVSSFPINSTLFLTLTSLTWVFSISWSLWRLWKGSGYSFFNRDLLWNSSRSALLKEKLKFFTEVTEPPPKQKLHNGCHKITKKSSAAPEIFFRIYILIQSSGFSLDLLSRVLILQQCPKKFVGKFQGFHYCQKVDKKGREIYTQFPTTHCTLWFDPIGFQHWRIREALIRSLLGQSLFGEKPVLQDFFQEVFFPEASVKFNRQDERKNCTENGEFLSQLLSQIRIEVFSRPSNKAGWRAKSAVESKCKQKKAPKFWYYFCRSF